TSLKDSKIRFCGPKKMMYISMLSNDRNENMAKKIKNNEPHSPKRSLSGLSRRYDTDPDSRIDKAVLDTIPYEYPRRAVAIDIDTDEFTAVCPYSGLPDF